MFSRWVYLPISACILTLAACQVPSSTADTISTFKGSGNEPGWGITINNEQSVDVLLDYGERKLTLDVVKEQVSSTKNQYSSTYNNQPVIISIEKKACQDNMSGEDFDYQVLFSIEGKRLNGCGRILTP